MSQFKLEIEPAGFNEARRGAGPTGTLRAAGERIVAAAGGAPDYELIEASSATRARFIIRTATAKARRAEAVDRTLSKAFNAGRG